MVRSKAEVRDELLKIDTGFKDKNGKKIGVDSFASFLTTKHKFPLYDDIVGEFEKSGIVDFKPSDFQSSGSKSKESKSNDFPKPSFDKESFAFPDDFFNEKDFKNDYMFVGLNAAYRTGDKDYSGWGNFRDTDRPTNTYKLYVQTSDKCFEGSYITDIIKSYEDSNSGNVMRNFFINDDEISFLSHPESTPNLDARRIDKLVLGHYQDELSKVKAMLTKADDDYKAGNKYVENKYKLKENNVPQRSKLKKLCIENKNTLDNSLGIFIRECLKIQPNWLVVFGADANEVLDKMVVSDYFKNKVDEIKNNNKEYKFNVMDLLEHRRVEVTHYATQSVPLKKYKKGSGDKKKNKDSEKEKRGYKFRDWVNYAPYELITKVDEMKEKEELRKQKESNNK
ncbi:hypothetical protein ACFQAV_03035 [Companilactobacillus huachuanensis]|uniref:Uncharacterized protein n=1 Tax=Companilactobacillus huachuanensis TaxID=2559914 RepID=A0ABW1RMY3_9LACO|nr:hypothetical protein [Companilactobacillus huachuanensis]